MNFLSSYHKNYLEDRIVLIFHPGEKIITQGYVVVLTAHYSMIKLSCMTAEGGVESEKFCTCCLFFPQLKQKYIFILK